MTKKWINIPRKSRKSGRRHVNREMLGKQIAFVQCVARWPGTLGKIARGLLQMLLAIDDDLEKGKESVLEV